MRSQNAYIRGAGVMEKNRVGQRPRLTLNLCHMSLVNKNLATATCDPACRIEILRKLVRKMSQAADGDWDWGIYELAEGFAKGDMSEMDMRGLRRWIDHLLSEEGPSTVRSSYNTMGN